MKRMCILRIIVEQTTRSKYKSNVSYIGRNGAPNKYIKVAKRRSKRFALQVEDELLL